MAVRMSDESALKLAMMRDCMRGGCGGGIRFFFLLRIYDQVNQHTSVKFLLEEPQKILVRRPVDLHHFQTCVRDKKGGGCGICGGCQQIRHSFRSDFSHTYVFYAFMPVICDVCVCVCCRVVAPYGNSLRGLRRQRRSACVCAVTLF